MVSSDLFRGYDYLDHGSDPLERRFLFRERPNDLALLEMDSIDHLITTEAEALIEGEYDLGKVYAGVTPMTTLTFCFNWHIYDLLLSNPQKKSLLGKLPMNRFVN
ncbi:hypothetical protein J4457_05570 [Candidatus Woesearchaeota archaeon]|nr:hypothetical protein [Candidatus Woesearchaeota archaeon]